MVSRILGSIVVLSCGLAHADGGETELVPSCAEVDAQRDTLSPELRTRAVQRLTRVLEREQLLVVTTGCIDHYVVSHEQAGDDLVVRVAGPHGIRRMRNGSVDKLDEMYARMVESLLAPPPPVLEARPAPEPAAADPDDSEDEDDADDDGEFTEDHDEAVVETAALEPYPPRVDDPLIDAVPPDEIPVAPDRILYGQLAVGSIGGGWGIGYRRHAAEHVAMDVSLSSVSNHMSSAVAFGVEALYVPRPRESMTPYIGGGLSFASEQDDAMSGDGPRAELTAGLSFARTGTFRWFTQVDAALPLFSMEDYNGYSSYRPSISFSLGLGF